MKTTDADHGVHSTAELDEELDAAMRSRFAGSRSAEAVIEASTDEEHEDQATHLRRLMRAMEAERDGEAAEFPSERPRWVGSTFVMISTTDSEESGDDETRAEDEAVVEEEPVRVTAAPVSRPVGGAKVIAVSSGKGGVGKTNVAVNLAVALNQRGSRVALVDADLGTANADVLCGLMPTARLDHVVTPLPVHDAARRTLEQIALTAPGGFQLIPGSAGIARMADLPEEQKRRLIDDLVQLESQFDVVLIDTAAGVGRSVVDFVRIADEALIVTTPEPTSMADAYALIKCLRLSEGAEAEGVAASDGPTPRIGLIVNQVESAQEGQRVHERLASVAKRFLGVEVHFVGAIAQDVRVGEAVRAKLPYVLYSPRGEATHDTREIAADLAKLMGFSATGEWISGAVARPSRVARWFGLGRVRR